MTNKIEAIKSNEVYKQILKDSFGGVMYSSTNLNKYNATEIIAIWESLEDWEKESCGGIMEGVFNFLLNK